jgi:hypothetical protein
VWDGPGRTESGSGGRTAYIGRSKRSYVIGTRGCCAVFLNRRLPRTRAADASLRCDSEENFTRQRCTASAQPSIFLIRISLRTHPPSTPIKLGAAFHLRHSYLNFVLQLIQILCALRLACTGQIPCIVVRWCTSLKSPFFGSNGAFANDDVVRTGYFDAEGVFPGSLSAHACGRHKNTNMKGYTWHSESAVVPSSSSGRLFMGSGQGLCDEVKATYNTKGE